MGPDVGQVVRKSKQIAAVRCTACNRPVGVAWFGGTPQLVDLAPVVAEGPKGRGFALMYHQCPQAGQEIPAPEPATARRNGFNGRRR